MTSKILSIDFETASLVDLKRTGVHTYAEHPSTAVLCMAWAFDNEPVKVWRAGTPFPIEVFAHVSAGGRVRAWNAGFEWVIWNKVLARQLIRFHTAVPLIDIHQLEDTMAAAAYWGLPMSLDQAGAALRLPIQKDKAGHALMMRMCKPRSHDPLTGKTTWWHETDPEKFDSLVSYCGTDVEVERAVARAIPPLPDDEREVWIADQRINARGVGVDMGFVESLRELALAAAADANRQLAVLTGGEVKSLNASAALLQWLREHGYPHHDLKKDTVARRLDDDDCVGLEREVLELRSDGAKTSAAKLGAMLDACPDRRAVGRVRGMLQYYGASRTGRWAGRLIQLQNMPRGSLGKGTEHAVTAIKRGAKLEDLEAVFGPAMGVVSSCLRACIVAEPGFKLVVADLAQIEARVVAWLAGQKDVLAVFASGQDIYVHTAAKIGSKDRQLGKVLVLACGFGMSGGKFQTTAETYKLFLSARDAEEAVRLWRSNNKQIVNFWYDCDRAARETIRTRQVVTVGPVKFGMFGNHMLINLPSGRNLVYRDAHLAPSPHDPSRQDICYSGTNQYTRKWEVLRTYGGKLVENITQAVARDVMREAILRAIHLTHDVILTVHDEILTEAAAPDADQQLADLLSIMRTPPKWAPGLPVDAAGYVAQRYKK
jgi:DNA polymerase bacteriophage-type